MEQQEQEKSRDVDVGGESNTSLTEESTSTEPSTSLTLATLALGAEVEVELIEVTIASVEGEEKSVAPLTSPRSSASPSSATASSAQAGSASGGSGGGDRDSSRNSRSEDFDFSFADFEVSDVQLIPDGAAKWNEEEAYLENLDFDFQCLMIREEAEATFSDMSGTDLWNMIDADGKLEGMEDETVVTGAAAATTTDALSNEGEQDGVFQIDLQKQQPLAVCHACENGNGDDILILLKDCGCFVCTACVINSALYSRRWTPGHTSLDVVCPACYKKHQDAGVGALPGFRQGVIGRKELEKTLSPVLFKEITEPLKTERERSRSKIFECATSACQGFCEVAVHQTVFRCPICNKTSNCFKCGLQHPEADPCPRMQVAFAPPSSVPAATTRRPRSILKARRANPAAGKKATPDSGASNIKHK